MARTKTDFAELGQEYATIAEFMDTWSYVATDLYTECYIKFNKQLLVINANESSHQFFVNLSVNSSSTYQIGATDPSYITTYTFPTGVTWPYINQNSPYTNAIYGGTPVFQVTSFVSPATGGQVLEVYTYQGITNSAFQTNAPNDLEIVFDHARNLYGGNGDGNFWYSETQYPVKMAVGFRPKSTMPATYTFVDNLGYVPEYLMFTDEFVNASKTLGATAQFATGIMKKTAEGKTAADITVSEIMLGYKVNAGTIQFCINGAVVHTVSKSTTGNTYRHVRMEAQTWFGSGGYVLPTTFSGIESPPLRNVIFVWYWNAENSSNVQFNDITLAPLSSCSFVTASDETLTGDADLNYHMYRSQLGEYEATLSPKGFSYLTPTGTFWEQLYNSYEA